VVDPGITDKPFQDANEDSNSSQAYEFFDATHTNTKDE